jgi:hypothetical protein
VFGFNKKLYQNLVPDNPVVELDKSLEANTNTSIISKMRRWRYAGFLQVIKPHWAVQLKERWGVKIS